MKNEWYADKLDLVKWGSLLLLARLHRAQRILQLAFYRESEYRPIVIDGKQWQIPRAVITHFRNLRSVESIRSKVGVSLFGWPFAERAAYQKAVLSF